MKLPTRILLTSAIFLVLIGVSVADSHISTEVSRILVGSFIYVLLARQKGRNCAFLP